MKITDIAYAAGAIDADGHITIKRTTQRMRMKRDCRNPIYSPRLSLGQVTPQVPQMLKEMFGGCIYVTKPGTRNSRPMFKWLTSDAKAVEVCHTLLQFLKIKHNQAQTVIDLYDLKKAKGSRKMATWFLKEHPKWRSLSLVTVAECAEMMGYNRLDCVYQAIANGTLLALPGHAGRNSRPRIPRLLVEQLIPLKGYGFSFISPPQMVAAQHAIYEKISTLNKVGVNGTCVNHKTGYHAQSA